MLKNNIKQKNQTLSLPLSPKTISATSDSFPLIMSHINIKLCQCFQSMLAHCGDYEERCQHLETLKNRLEAILSPQLVSAFNTHSLGKLACRLGVAGGK